MGGQGGFLRCVDRVCYDRPRPSADSVDCRSVVSRAGETRTVVAAGVGYENAETSTITVKTYDAENGAILSDETYELNVREDAASADSQPRERIFAGGVGPGGRWTFSVHTPRL